MVSIGLDQNVVIYSEPGSDGFRMCHQSDFGSSESSEHLDTYFVIRPYSEDHDAIFIAGEVDREIDVRKIVVDLPESSSIPEVIESEYVESVKNVVSRLESAGDKVVLSRISHEKVEYINIGASLEVLRAKFPEALVYFINSTGYGAWLGATPEHLIVNEGDDFQTMALAGTKWGDELFTQKEFDEQFAVTKTIVGALQDETIEVSDVEECAFGELRHLRTFIRWQSEKSLKDFAERFHPTPAVCGCPTSKARAIINELELHDRLLYTGYIGMVRSKTKSTLFVNIRCMQLFRNALCLHVGGGINKASDPTSEWEETERKKSAVLSAIVYE